MSSSSFTPTQFSPFINPNNVPVSPFNVVASSDFTRNVPPMSVASPAPPSNPEHFHLQQAAQNASSEFDHLSSVLSSAYQTIRGSLPLRESSSFASNTTSGSTFSAPSPNASRGLNTAVPPPPFFNSLIPPPQQNISSTYCNNWAPPASFGAPKGTMGIGESHLSIHSSHPQWSTYNWQ
ncbi:hypothetical protein AB6A40_009418 [Gnathostoma spinigerum]|uniref:Uncharacterized protein n=1 Tax=Gnathostoma spinigerum TaxID=75299 RepID=A0ABD6ERX4_9BILA